MNTTDQSDGGVAMNAPSNAVAVSGENHPPTVFQRDGRVFANSRVVAAVFEKEHFHVLRDIENLLENQQHPKMDDRIRIPDGWFVEQRSPRLDGPGRPLRSVDMTRDGFTLLAMGFTGAKALQFQNNSSVNVQTTHSSNGT
ncbi:MAG: Rha family transcriptional regulator [Alphaproteobacteria bacterium]